MAILVDRQSRVLCQGITGKAGAFHTRHCVEYGTNVVAGVTPGKGGQRFDDRIPVFDTVREATAATGADTSMIFVPAQFCRDAILEAIDAALPLVIVITEGIPVHDMLQVKATLRDRPTRLVGPNCPGVISPGEAKVGIMPGYIHTPGPVGIISRSGTLTYEAVWQLTRLGIGQSTSIGLGGDQITGTSMREAMELFAGDDQTEGVLLIGEIGGGAEQEAADLLREGYPKPVAAYVAGVTAPPGKRMGHAGAIVGSRNETAEAKIKVLEQAGAAVCRRPGDIGATVKAALGPA
jgi:succinyl-CoA synthetase alpha subunit